MKAGELLRVGVIFLQPFVLILASVAQAAELSFQSPTVIRRTTDLSEVKRLSVGESWVPTEDEPYYLESQGRIPVLLLPSKGSSLIEVRAPEVADWPNIETMKRLNNSLNEILNAQKLIRSELAKGQGQSALQRINLLIEKYPGLSSLHYMRASAHFVLGQRELAMAALETAMLIEPNDASSISLRKALEGVR